MSPRSIGGCCCKRLLLDLVFLLAGFPCKSPDPLRKSQFGFAMSGGICCEFPVRLLKLYISCGPDEDSWGGSGPLAPVSLGTKYVLSTLAGGICELSASWMRLCGSSRSLIDGRTGQCPSESPIFICGSKPFTSSGGKVLFPFNDGSTIGPCASVNVFGLSMLVRSSSLPPMLCSGCWFGHPPEFSLFLFAGGSIGGLPLCEESNDSKALYAFGLKSDGSSSFGALVSVMIRKPV